MLSLPPSEWWLVDVDGLVSLQYQLWTGLAEAEPELHQPNATQRGGLL